MDYYLFAGDLHEIDTCIKTFCFDKLTHYQSNFVIYVQMKTSDSRVVVQNVLELFWNHEHQNVVDLADGNAGDIEIFTWYPLEVTPHVEIVDQCNGISLRYEHTNVPLANSYLGP